ncbi:MAG: threonine synthase [Peptococcaceae bacterium]|nr:threonine synthase [Peptococcaceae bacterium]
MLYESTRGQFKRVQSAEAITLGISPDGGLFVPRENVLLDREQLKKMAALSYRDKAVLILKEYLTDFTEEELGECVALAYNSEKFDSPEIAPVRRLDEGLFVLELWHGPTCAFKDMALQILPHLLTRAAAKTGEEATIVILVATSGDTGKAALEGFKNVPGTRVIVFYPEEGVSEVQKLQMVTQEGDNVAVVAVRGNFDDAQTGVKNIFGNAAFNRELAGRNYRLSSANSINWGRLAPQIVYYFSAYLDLAARGEIATGEKVNFVVPTGNFGNILAAFYAREMGLPVHRLICAANANNVLTGFIRTGVYDRNRQFQKTISPSMDILISSNLERLLYHLSGRDYVKVQEWMAALSRSGVYQTDELTRARIGRLFWSDFAGDGETLATIRDVHRRYGYVVDTHTAVGLNVYEKYAAATGDGTKTIVASTASPFKFNESVARAILGEEAVRGRDEFRLLEDLAAAGGMEIPPGLRDLDKKPVLHRKTAAREQMLEAVKDILLP